MRSLTLFLLGLALAAPAARADIREIIVTGQGDVDVAPDLATVTTGVESQAATAEAALDATSAAMREVLEAMEAAGIERADIQTSQISLTPVWSDQPVPGPGRGREDRPPMIAGYAASNLVTIRVRELARLGAVLDAVSRAGGNRIHGIGFSLAEPRRYEDEARAAAVADARAKAELYASAAGVGLGPVLAMRETAPLDRPFPMRAMAEAAMDVPVAEGTLTLTALVEIVYAIEDDEGATGEDAGNGRDATNDEENGGEVNGGD
ncbi:SIMPL domain-containing protein [soil metagenome]